MWVISFNIDNNQEEYAKVAYFVECLQGKNILEKSIFWKKIKFLNYEDKKALSEYILVNSEKEGIPYSGEEINLKDKVEYKLIFYVNCSEEDDMVNIIYFCLLNDMFKGKCIFCVRNNEEDKKENAKLASNVFDMFSYLFSQNSMPRCYVWNGNKYNLIRKGNRVIKRFSPIFSIEEDNETVVYWRQSVQSFYKKLYKDVPIGGGKSSYLQNYFLPQLTPMRFLTKEERKREYEKSFQYGVDYWISRIFVECFCGKEKNTKAYVEKRYEKWVSKEFFDLVKDIPLLAMYIFCIFDFFLATDENDNYESIKNEIFNARDMAEGILQILENIYHSENKKGYFCFRIHSSADTGKGNYLKKQYEKYMLEKGFSSNGETNFLEFRIVDYSHLTIPKKFYENFQKRKENANERDKKKYFLIEEQANNIRVEDFFKASPFWQTYNSISENVVNHYGLQIFDSFVACYDGYFRVRSQEEYYADWGKDVYCSLPVDEDTKSSMGLPGTQYDIVIPFKEEKTLQNISLNVNINYTDYLLHKFDVVQGIGFSFMDCVKIFNKIPFYDENGIKYTYQERKELTIKKLLEKLKKQLATSKNKKNKKIIHFSADEIGTTMIELFCKTIMLYIAQKDKRKNCYIMITECTKSHFVEITRMLALFYDKQGQSSLMSNTQIFLSGKEDGEEFLISGINLGEVVGRTEKLAFARCVHPECLRILKNMLKNRAIGVTPNETVSIVPFDMVDYCEGEDTLFIKSLRKVLEKDVQAEEFGCKLNDLHVRIGSKIHIRTFYEAELLFHNNYYTSRFAYWLFSNIRKDKRIEKTKPITLVGYENYSEMLLNELQDMLKEANYQSEYIIYEQKALEKFRTVKNIEEYRDSQFIFIVPINSTTSTHVKLSGFLKKTIKREMDANHVLGSDNYQFKRIINYGILLISPNGHNRYWVKQGDNTIKSLINNEVIKYFVEATAEWLHPLKCKACFPEDDYCNENPLVETNKESVVPMQAIGIHRRDVKRTIRTTPQEEIKRLEELSQFLIYNHIERNGNHYNYYFSTEKLWNFPKIRENIRGWLERNKNNFPKSDKKVYDIIVAPLHFSNAAFVEEVNHCLFSNAALVLHFDVNREYRTNIKTKYSNIQQLYDNLSEDNETSIINFHYVDDTIISGQTFYRTRSLIQSLINTRDDSSVKINIFKSIVLLISRLSTSSIRNYIDNSSMFIAYFKLNISSMRVNEDACVLCKKSNEWNMLAEQASLNEVYSYWKNKSEGVQCKSVEKVYRIEKQKSKMHRQRAEQYMIASHRAKTLLESLYGRCNGEEIEEQIIMQLFPEKNNFSLQEMIAMLKVLGRPFLNFRKETKEVVFRLMLKMLDTLLKKDEPIGKDKLATLLKIVWHNQENRTTMIMILINRLVELESNYIIRKRSIDTILDYAKEATTNNSEFIENFLNRIKQLTGQSNDFTKCLYLEFILLYGVEYIEAYQGMPFAYENIMEEFEEFRDKIFLENTKVASYGIVLLAESLRNSEEYGQQKLLEVMNENYYFDNFIEYLAFHKAVKMSDVGKIEEFISEPEAKKIEGMVRFQLLYESVDEKRKEKKEDISVQDSFATMMRYLCMASGASDGEIIVPFMIERRKDPIYLALGLHKGTEMDIKLKDTQNLAELIESNDGFTGNTYTIIEEGNKKWLLIKFINQVEPKASTIPIVYMLFLFEDTDRVEIMCSLKNILMFRNKIWKILNLSSNTLLQNWSSSLFYKQQMLKTRSILHGEFRQWKRELLDISKEVNDKDNIPNVTIKCFELLVNAMIGHMNSQMLGGKNAGLNDSEYSIGIYWKRNGIIFQAMAKLWNMQINYLDEKEVMKAEVRACTEFTNQYPDMEELTVIIMAALQNIHKHSADNDGEMTRVDIFKEGGNLCIRNLVSEENVEMLKKKICENAYRSGIGISMAVIADACSSWYVGTSYADIYHIIEDSNAKYFVVKLPIIGEGE